MESWILVAVIAVLTTSAILSLTFYYLYFSYNQTYMSVLGAAFSCYVARNICIIGNISQGGTSNFMLGAEQFCVLATSMLLLYGVTLFANTRFPRWLVLAATTDAVWILVAIIMALPRTALYVPTYALLGTMQILCGITLLKQRNENIHFGKTMAAVALLLWGAHQFDYPLLRHIAWFAPWGFLTGAVLSLTVAMGIIVMFFEHIQSLEGEHAAHLRLLLENVGDAIYLAEKSGRILETNKEAQNLTGYTREELLELNVSDIDALETQESWGRLVLEIKPGWKHSFFSQHRRKDGDTFPVEVSAVGYSHQGQLRILGIAKNITERKHAEDALRASEERLRVIADNTYDWEYWRGPAGNYLWVSPAFERTTGYPTTLFNATGDAAFNNMIHPDDQHIWVDHIGEVDKYNPDHRELEFRIVKPTGEIVWLAHTCKPIFAHDGVLLGRRGCNRNITERKLFEQAMAASLHEKEVLLREIHHRVKNNLQIISSLLSLQEQGVDDPSVQDVLTESQGRVTSMALIHEQLYLSDDFREIDIADYLHTFIPKLVSSYQGNRDISVQMELTRVLLSLDQAIPFGLVVNELVTNALKHGFQGRTKGTVSITTLNDQGDVVLIIEDDGKGLTKEFDLLHVTTLGLQIITMLADQLRGTLVVEPASGARFKLRFPLRPPSIGEESHSQLS